MNQKNFEELIEFVENVGETIEESENIGREPTGEEFYGFKRFEEKVPVFIKSDREYFVEIALKHKQKAVGYQSMVFLCIWVKNLEGNLIGRTARPKEFAKFRITKKNGKIVEDVVKAFAIASKQHNEDMRVLLKVIKDVDKERIRI